MITVDSVSFHIFNYNCRITSCPFRLDEIDSNLLRHASSSKPDPMSIGVVLVIFFFVILLLAISTSFILYHNQRRKQENHLHHHNASPRKLTNGTLTPYLSANHTLASSLNRTSLRFVNAGQLSRSSLLHQPVVQNAIGSLQQQQQLLPPPVPAARASSIQRHVQQSQTTASQANGPPLPSSSNMHSMNKFQYRPEMANAMMHHQNSHSIASDALLEKHQPDIVSLNPIASSSGHSATTAGSESASVIASRIQMPNGGPASSIYTNSENYNTDNYSNIMATAEHYDLENASSIAPSDIDIVYHYKGYRHREPLQQSQGRHAPLSRLSPSVSELSSVPRILTLQDLSPQVPNHSSNMHLARSRMHKSGTSSLAQQHNSINHHHDDDVAITENSYTCSEFGENYDLSKKHVW